MEKTWLHDSICRQFFEKNKKFQSQQGEKIFAQIFHPILFCKSQFSELSELAEHFWKYGHIVY